MYKRQALGKVIKVTKDLCLKLFLAITPHFVITAYKKSKQKSLTSTNKLFSQLKFALTSLRKSISTKKDNMFTQIDKIQHYPAKEKGIEKFQNFKIFLVEFRKSSPKEHLINLQAWSREKLKWIYAKFSFTKSHQFKLGISLSFLSILGLYAIYFGSSRILDGEYPSRTIASVQEYDYRPDYKYYQDKTLKVLNVKVPIYVEKQGSIDSITIDFSLRLSTKFSRYFLQEYDLSLIHI